ncbi:hypothetical protein CSPAE12_04428 [Colletotrichum incanum]|nr:hypothetical protein CSPAE12_04428 [Colletotrichum incanum]
MKVSPFCLAAIGTLLGQSEALFCFFRPLFLPLPILTIGSGGGGGGVSSGGGSSGQQQSCPAPSCTKPSCPPPRCLPLTDPTPYGDKIADCQMNGIGALFKEDGSFSACDW